MEEPRKYTTDEIREQFLDHVRSLVDYWNGIEKDTSKEKLEGLAFSILSAIDGSSCNVPGFILAPSTHESDKEYHIDNDENYYPQNHESDVKCDIGGSLHELFYKKELK